MSKKKQGKPPRPADPQRPPASDSATSTSSPGGAPAPKSNEALSLEIGRRNHGGQFLAYVAAFLLIASVAVLWSRTHPRTPSVKSVRWTPRLADSEVRNALTLRDHFQTPSNSFWMEVAQGLPKVTWSLLSNWPSTNLPLPTQGLNHILAAGLNQVIQSKDLLEAIPPGEIPSQQVLRLMVITTRSIPSSGLSSPPPAQVTHRLQKELLNRVLLSDFSKGALAPVPELNDKIEELDLPKVRSLSPAEWAALAVIGVFHVVSLALISLFGHFADKESMKQGAVDPPEFGDSQTNPHNSAVSNLRELISHENELVNHRLGWLLQIQGLGFAALTFAWEKEIQAVVYVLCVLGTVVAVCASGPLQCANAAIIRLAATWVTRTSGKSQLAQNQIIGLFRPRVDPAEFRWVDLMYRLGPGEAFPRLFVLSWSILAVINTLGF